MTIRSELGHGQIYAGATPLASSIAIEQTGPMQLTFRAGTFTTTGDARRGIAPQTYTLAADAVVDLTADALMTKYYSAWLAIDLTGPLPEIPVDVLVMSRLDEYPSVPLNWEIIHQLVYEFAVPPGTTDLSGIDIYVLTVLPGFPEGTTEADWLKQTGQV